MKILLLIVVILLAIFSFAFMTIGCGDGCSDSYKTRLVSTRIDLDTISVELNRYMEEHKKYPKSLKALVPKYLKKVPVDVWGRSYILEVFEGEVRLYTYGEDGKLGGKGLSHDFSNSTNWDEYFKHRHN